MRRPETAPARARHRDWRTAAAAAAAAVTFSSAWFLAREILRGSGAGFGPALLNKALAVSALGLVAYSMLLTGVARFFPRFRKSLALRKAFGLTGFGLGLAHALINHAVLDTRSSPELAKASHPGVMLGAVAVFVFAAMAVASFGPVRRSLGADRWRKFLRYAGYAGLIAAAAHAAILKGGSWARYLRTFGTGLPSLSLPAVALAALAVALRVAVWAAGRRRKPAEPTSASPRP